MPKKIYDIKPPKVVHKVQHHVLKEDKTKKHNSHRKKEVRSIWLPVSIAVLFVIILAGTFLFFKLPKADITIWPKVETLSYTQTIKADKLVDSADLSKGIIPAQYFEVSKTLSQDFPATGNASDEGKASGTITIYNKYDPVTPFTFKAGTRFVSDSGKLFIASQKIVIPAAKKSGSKITPGSVQVKVQAVEGGDSYNIAPSNFSVPGLKGTSYYYSIYAASTSAMTGGYAGKVKKVTDDDIQGAKDVLVKQAVSDATADLKNQISSDYILLDNAISNSTTSASTQTKIGTIADSFTYKATVKVGALAFKKSDADQFAKDYITSQMPEKETMLSDSFKISYSAGTVDISGGKATLDLDFSSDVYRDIDKNSISLSLLGENANQINQTINNSIGDEVSKIKINFWPFWVTKAPNSQKRVNVELKFQ